MKQDIKLYINDMPVDFSSELSMPFNYMLEDTNNPTIVKNMFTKTITIVGTANNNKIFGDIFNFDREQLYSDEYLTGAYFNPSVRTPFKLFRDGELIESGYMQLNSITLKNKVINYEITLYGGIGDFFYNLSYNKNNEPLTLSDLKYKVRDKYGNVLDADREMDFRINADVVRSNWEQLKEGIETGTINDYIAFVPSYNGVYENFDNNKVLINANNSEIFENVELSKMVDDTLYLAYNGYLLAELKDEFTEWAMRDLRSYNQRPALKVSKLIEAISNPENNGGYKVNLDNSFFNKGNSNYNNAYISLPLFTTIMQNDDSSNNKTDVPSKLSKTLTLSGGTEEVVSYVIPSSNSVISSSNNVINTNNTPVQSTLNMSLDYQLFVKSNIQSDLYDGYLYTISSTTSVGGVVVPLAYNIICATATFVQAVAEDSSGDVIGYSNVYQFSNVTDNFGGISQKVEWLDYNPKAEAPIVKVNGNWVYDSISSKHYFKSNEGGNTFNISINNIKRATNFTIKLYMWRCSNTSEQFASVGKLVSSQFYSDATPPSFYSATFTLTNDTDYTTIGIITPSSNIYTNALITKQKLLKTEKTPADYLLSYCKLFGLYFLKDTADKTINILRRDNYFTNKVNDWNSRIDRSQDIKISPMVFNSKFYRMALNTNGDYYAEKYKNEYGVDYGQKRINTNYNFNADTKDLLTDNVFTKSIPVLGTSKYYRNFFNNDGKQIPAFLVEGLTYKLFNETTTGIESTDIELTSNVNLKATKQLNNKSGYDLFEKECFFKLDNGKEILNDASNCLLFYNGMTKVANNVTYWLTDDLPEMGIINDGKPCFIYTEDAFDGNECFVGYSYARLPQFLSVNKKVNTIVDSFDFSLPRETYIPNVNYAEEATIFNRYWGNLYNDQLDINTKKVTANVNLNGVDVNSNSLRDFYYFGGSNWILNKVENYEPNKDKTTKCEFIKVQNPVNYTSVNAINKKYISCEYEKIVDYVGSMTDVTVYANTDWQLGAYTDNNTRLSVTSGTTGEVKAKYRYNTNNTYDFKELGFSLLDKNDKWNTNCIVRIKQVPNPNNVIKVKGVITPLYNGTIRFVNSSGTVLSKSKINQSGTYETYAPKDVSCTMQILEDDEVVKTETFLQSKDIEKNITL